MSKSEDKDTTEAGAVPSRVLDWAVGIDTQPEFQAARLSMEQLYYFKSDEEGFVNLRCSLTGRAFRVPALSPVLTIVVEAQYAGEHTADSERYRIHPAIAILGEDGVRDALRSAVESSLEEAAEAVHRANRFAEILGSPLPVEWPAYWTVESEAKLRGVK